MAYSEEDIRDLLDRISELFVKIRAILTAAARSIERAEYLINLYNQEAAKSIPDQDKIEDLFVEIELKLAEARQFRRLYRHFRFARIRMEIKVQWMMKYNMVEFFIKGLIRKIKEKKTDG
jgi:hypothetical protein